MPPEIEVNRLACDEPTSRTVDVEQFCSWSACRMNSMSSARTSSGSTSYGSAGSPNVIRRKFSTRRHRVVRVEERLPDRLLERIGRDRGQLGQQADGGQLDLLVVERIQRVLVVRAQRIDRTGEHGHRMRVAREAVEEPLQVLVQQRVPLDLGGELLELIRCRQLTVDQQVADLDEVRLLGELLDRDSRGSAESRRRRRCR